MGFASVLAGSAGAGVSVDLIWRDSGVATLGFIDPSAGSAGPGSGCGFNHGVLDGRCLFVVWTTTRPVFVGSNSIGWEPAQGLEARFASFFAVFNEIPVGKSAAFRGVPGSVAIDNRRGLAGSFTGRSGLPPPDGQDALPPGTYLVGTIVLDVSGVASEAVLQPTLRPGFDTFIDIDGRPITDVVLQSARVVNLVPEPGTGLLLAVALLALAAGRARQQRSTLNRCACRVPPRRARADRA